MKRRRGDGVIGIFLNLYVPLKICNGESGGLLKTGIEGASCITAIGDRQWSDCPDPVPSVSFLGPPTPRQETYLTARRYNVLTEVSLGFPILPESCTAATIILYRKQEAKGNL